MANAPYGTKYDARIAKAIKAGTPLAHIALKLTVGASFVGRRGHALGLSDQIRQNGLEAKARASAGGGSTAKRWRALVAEIGKAPADRLVSDVARSLRACPAELSETAIAALHERGLTVDELCEGTRRPPFMIVRAVREAARCA